MNTHSALSLLLFMSTLWITPSLCNAHARASIKLYALRFKISQDQGIDTLELRSKLAQLYQILYNNLGQDHPVTKVIREKFKYRFGIDIEIYVIPTYESEITLLKNELEQYHHRVTKHPKPQVLAYPIFTPQLHEAISIALNYNSTTPTASAQELQRYAESKNDLQQLFQEMLDALSNNDTQTAEKLLRKYRSTPGYSYNPRVDQIILLHLIKLKNKSGSYF